MLIDVREARHLWRVSRPDLALMGLTFVATLGLGIEQGILAGVAATAVLAAIGLGLALPFVLVTLVPGWARFIPKPGPWMLRFRAGLGFALLATVVWLLWVMGRAVGVDDPVGFTTYQRGSAFLRPGGDA